VNSARESIVKQINVDEPATPETGSLPRAQVISLSELQEPSKASAAPLITSTNPLHHVRARLQVCIGEVVVTVGELLAAKQDSVVQLNRAIDQPVDLLLEGQVVARGHLVAVDEHFAIRITELPLPLKP
jgi:flagellar motor switch protein FliN